MENKEILINGLIQNACEITEDCKTEEEIQQRLEGLLLSEYKCDPDIKPEQAVRLADALSDVIIRKRSRQFDETLAFKQKFHIGDRVFYIENKPAGNGGFLRDAYILKDGIITEISIVVESKLISRKKYDGKNFTGEPDIVRFAPKDYATGEYYHVNSAAGMKAAVGLFATEKEAEERFKEMKQEYPKVTLEKNIESYEVEYV